MAFTVRSLDKRGSDESLFTALCGCDRLERTVRVVLAPALCDLLQVRGNDRRVRFGGDRVHRLIAGAWFGISGATADTGEDRRDEHLFAAMSGRDCRHGFAEPGVGRAEGRERGWTE